MEAQNYKPYNIEDDKEGLVRFYIYALTKTKTSNSFINANATSLIYIDNSLFAGKHKIIKDENYTVPEYYLHGKYFNRESQTLDYVTHTSGFGMELESEPTSLSFITNANISNGQSVRSVKKLSNTYPLVFTINEPYDMSKYIAGDQIVWIADTISRGKDAVDDTANVSDPDGLYEVSLSNSTAIQRSFQHSELLFHRNAKFYEPIEKDKLAIEIDTTSLLGGVGGKGEFFAGIENDFDFIDKDQLIPMKATAVDTQDKVTMFLDWFDHDVVMPKFISNIFNKSSGATIGDVKTAGFINQAEVDLITDMLELSYIYATSFAGFAKYTAQEAKDTPSAKEGQIKGDLKMGSKGDLIWQFENKDPVKSIDGIFDRYLRETAGAEDSSQLMVAKTIICALSRYIYSSYSISKGQNSFNQIYLPYYLKSVNEMSLNFNPTTKVYRLNDVRFRLNSRFFRTKGTNPTLAQDLDPITDINLSSSRLIQTDRKLVIPRVSPTLQEMGKLPLPGDIDTKSNKDLQYFWYLPFYSQEILDKLLFNNSTIISNDPNTIYTFTTDFAQPGRKITQPITYIRSQASFKFHAPNYNDITVISQGAVEYTNSIKYTTDTSSISFFVDRPPAANTKNLAWYLYNNNYATASSARRERLLKEAIEMIINDGQTPITFRGVDADEIVLLDVPANIVRSVNIVGQIVYTMPSVNYELRSIRYVDAQVRIAGTVTTTLSTDRQTIFDKREWDYYIKRTLNVIGQKYKVILRDEKQDTILKLYNLTITSLWGNDFNLIINDEKINIECFNRDNETMTEQQIILS